jgi:hypothetical protein
MKGGFGCSPCCGGGVCSVVYNGLLYIELTTDIWGQRFQTPPGGLTVYSVTTFMIAGQTLTDASKAVLKIYSHEPDPFDEFGSGQPDSVIATLTSPGSVSLQMQFTSTGISLAGDTLYWIVLSNEAGIGANAKTLRWEFGEEDISCYPFSRSAGKPIGYPFWFESIGQPFRYSIN